MALKQLRVKLHDKKAFSPPHISSSQTSNFLMGTKIHSHHYERNTVSVNIEFSELVRTQTEAGGG